MLFHHPIDTDAACILNIGYLTISQSDYGLMNYYLEILKTRAQENERMTIDVK